MTDKLTEAWTQLKDFLDMTPIDRAESFKIQAVNNGRVVCHGMLKNQDIQMDHLQMGDSVETRWMIKDTDMHFLVFKGFVELYFRADENIHCQKLSHKQSLRIPAGVPFMLRTYESKCKILLISISGKK